MNACRHDVPYAIPCYECGADRRPIIRRLDKHSPILVLLAVGVVAVVPGLQPPELELDTLVLCCSGGGSRICRNGLGTLA